MQRPSMYLSTLVHLTLLSGVVYAFSGGWVSFPQNTRQQHRCHRCSFGRLSSAVATSSAITTAGSFADATRWRRGQSSKRWWTPAAAVAPKRQLRLMPNEYEAFFNKASKLGADATRGLAPEERARRAMEGEKLEDDIIEIATVLREKADEMVAETGAINFEIIQPMIDEIAVLKDKYKIVMGASEAPRDDGGDCRSSGADMDDGDTEITDG